MCMARAATTTESPAMKFKMAPNSLFAVLLRSPWWISILIAIVFAGASKALLPDEYWIFGAMGGFPMLAIGCIALWQQLQAPSAKKTEAILNAVSAMSWRDFANALEQAWQRDGYTVQRAEGAADFVLTRQGKTAVVAAKRWKAAKPGVEALQDLHAAMQARGASECQYVTLGTLSDNAQRFARTHQVKLVQPDALVLLLRHLPATATP